MDTWDSEFLLVERIAYWLESQGWAILQKNPKRGADIIAEMNGIQWVIEVKGIGSRPEMKNNFFVYALGQLLQRMSDDNSKYSVAFPEDEKFRRLWRELPILAKKRTGVTVLFVSKDGQINTD